MWDLRFSWLYGDSPDCLSRSCSVALNCSSECGTSRFPELTVNPQRISAPPGVCGTWPLLTVWDPRFPRAHRQPATYTWSRQGLRWSDITATRIGACSANGKDVTVRELLDLRQEQHVNIPRAVTTSPSGSSSVCV